MTVEYSFRLHARSASFTMDDHNPEIEKCREMHRCNTAVYLQSDEAGVNVRTYEKKECPTSTYFIRKRYTRHFHLHIGSFYATLCSEISTE